MTEQWKKADGLDNSKAFGSALGMGVVAAIGGFFAPEVFGDPDVEQIRTLGEDLARSIASGFVGALIAGLSAWLTPAKQRLEDFAKKG